MEKQYMTGQVNVKKSIRHSHANDKTDTGKKDKEFMGLC
jgi:hypothetical protein